VNLSSNTLLLLHLADSALPVGGFAYSYGLEAAVRHGLLTNQQQVSSYLSTYAEQVLSFDVPFVSSAYHLENLSEITQLFSDYEAMLLNPFVKKANVVMGKNWLRLFSKLYGLEDLEKRALKEKWSGDFPVVFGVCAKQIGLSYTESLHLYFYCTVRDQISALIRLGAAGPSWGHSQLNDLLSDFEAIIQSTESKSHSQACKSAYLQEVAQLSHDRVYSKLFQN